MYLNQYWKDERLAFSSNDEVLTLPGDFAEKIWVPDTFFANDKNRFVFFIYLHYLNFNIFNFFLYGRCGCELVHSDTKEREQYYYCYSFEYC